MAKYSDHLTNEVRLEYMRPAQIDQAKERMPTIYVPFGAIEWHGYHNPVGLDGLKAHELLVGLAARVGGVVYPSVYFGAGGGHIGWPSTFMVAREPMVALVSQLLHGFEADGYQQAILLSGHYPNRTQYLNEALARYRDEGGRLRAIALVENEAPEVDGDHAAKMETSYMLALHPETVDMTCLTGDPKDDIGGADELINWMADEYKGHPCYGLVGIDPRAHASAAVGEAHGERLLCFLEDWLRKSDA